MADIFEKAETNARFLVGHLGMLDGNKHPDRNYGSLAVGLFNTDEPNRISIHTANIGTNPFPEKEAKYGALALDKLTGNFSYWQRHQDRVALSRAPTVDEERWRFLGSALTIMGAGFDASPSGMVTAYSGHPEGLIDEAISGVTNYSVGLASEEQLEEIARMSENRHMAPMLELYRKLRKSP